MPSNNRITIAGMGGIRPYLNALAEMNNSDKDFDWLEAQAAKIDAGEITKKEVYEAMGITANTLEKYLTLLKIDRVQHGN
jgi:hypothetical protein